MIISTKYYNVSAIKIIVTTHTHTNLIQLDINLLKGDINIAHATCYIKYENYYNLRQSKCFINAICTIGYIGTTKTYRNKGYATEIIKYIKKYCYENKIKIITLDDCSDNFNKENNIYLKNGFQYIESGFPEMYFNVF